MAQLSLFSRSELATMRDRTKSRRYSSQRDAFRREHQRRRDHGKAQRHAARIYQAFQQPGDDEAPQFKASPADSADRRGRPSSRPGAEQNRTPAG